MRNDGLIKTFVAETAVSKYRVVKFGAAAGTVTHAAASTDNLIGCTIELPADAGQRVDVALTEIGKVEYGGAVAAGDWLTSDSEGRAVVAAAGNQVIGRAFVAGVLGQIGSVLFDRGQL